MFFISTLPGALNEILEDFARFAIGHITFGEPRDHSRNVLRRNGHDGQSVGAGVVLPLAAEHDLEMRNRIVRRSCG